jgi:hypothetical protein
MEGKRRSSAARYLISITIFVILLIQTINLATAQAGPVFPNSVDVLNTTRRSQDEGAKTHAAEAGNVTALSIQGDAVTKTWQGYYGQVTGDIYLANVANVSLFAWTDVSPQGEVYAANSTVSDWGNVQCANLSTDDVGDNFKFNWSTLESFFNVSYTASDGISETFANVWTGAALFDIGPYYTVNNGKNCHYNYTFVSSAPQTSSFIEVVLQDNATGSVIWATVLEQDATGFDGTPEDFQIIVAEDGFTSLSQTTYYFYVEIE